MDRAGVGAAPLIGRALERRLLREELHRATTGRTRVALLAGEPGIGKSTLLAAVAAGGAVVLRGGASEAEGMPPYLRAAAPADLRIQAGELAPVPATILPELRLRIGGPLAGIATSAPVVAFGRARLAAAWAGSIVGRGARLGCGGDVARLRERAAAAGPGPRGPADLRRLEHVRDLLVAQGRKADGCAFGLFARRGFDRDLAAQAAPGGLVLVDLPALYGAAAPGVT